MAKRTSEKGLGRGLGALFGEEAILESEGTTTTLSLSKIEPNLAQPRKNFSEESLQDLADSIRKHGVLQPITVRKLGSGYYQIISGERRWRASKLAGLHEIPAMVISADDRKSLELALIENLQREDLNPMEEASGYRLLMTEYSMTQEEIAEQVGKSRPVIANALRLLTLPESIQTMVSEGKISAGHARTLIPLENSELQIHAAIQILEEGLSVRKTEALVKKLTEEKKPKKKKEDPNQIYYAEAETNLSSHLGRRVHISHSRQKGKLELEYYSMDDLNDLLDALHSIKMMKKEAES